MAYVKPNHLKTPDKQTMVEVLIEHARLNNGYIELRAMIPILVERHCLKPGRSLVTNMRSLNVEIKKSNAFESYKPVEGMRGVWKLKKELMEG